MSIKGRLNLTYILNFIAVFIFLSACSCRKQGNQTVNNSLLIDSFIQQAQDSSYNNMKFSRDLLKKAMKMATDSVTYYKAFNTYVLTYSTLNQYDSAFLLTHKVMNFCKFQKKTPIIHELLASSNNNLGIYYGQMSMTDSSLKYSKEALKEYELSDKRDRIPDMYINIADIYSRKGNFAMSAFYYRKALSKSDSLHITYKMGFPIYFGLGQVYMELRDFDLSNNYYRLAEKFYNDRSLAEKFIYCNNRGNYYYYKEEYANALPWFKKAKALVSKGDYQFYLSLCYVNMGDIYLNLNKLDSVQPYLDKSYAYFSTIKNKTALYYIATIRAGLAVKQNNKKLAEKLFKDTQDSTGIELNMLSIRNKYLQKYYTQTGNFKQAYYYQAKNKAIDDSLRNERADKRIAEIDLRYQQDTTLINKKLVIQQQASQVKFLKITTFLWILICILAAAVSVFIYFYMKKKRDLQRVKYIDNLTNLRMENIRNRISPHFIFNVLNSEICTLEEHRRKNLYTLVTLMRKNLQITEKVSICMVEELSFVSSYIELEKRNMGDNFDLEWNIDNQIDLENTFILSMSIQIPVENALKHALRPKEGYKKLSINVSGQQDGVNIFIRDNGAGYFPQQTSKTKGTGTGLKVLFQTIQLLNGKNINQVSLTIQNIREKEQIKGTEVYIFVPYNYKFE